MAALARARRIRRGTQKFGDVLRRCGLGTETAIQDALLLQERIRKAGAWIPIGELLTRSGVLDTRTCEAVLAIQAAQPGEERPVFRLADTRRRSRHVRLGELAVRTGLLDEHAIARAMRLLRVTRPLGAGWKIGEVLVRERALDGSLVEALLQIQRQRNGVHLGRVHRLRRLADWETYRFDDLLFGRLAIQHGFIGSSQLEDALSAQRVARSAGRSIPLGEILREQGALIQRHVDAVAEIQTAKRESYLSLSGGRVTAPRPEEPTLGSILCRKGLLQERRLAECLKVQRDLGSLGLPQPLGRILLQSTDLSADALHSVLDEQQVARAALRAARIRRKRVWRVVQAACAAVLVVALSRAGGPDRPGAGVPGLDSFAVTGTGAASSTGNEVDPLLGRPPGPDSAVRRSRISHPALDEESLRQAAAAEARIRALHREARRHYDARARARFSETDGAGLQVAVECRLTPAGPILAVFGSAPFPEGTRVRTEVRYFGVAIPETIQVSRVQGGVFQECTGPLRGPGSLSPGLYTAIVECLDPPPKGWNDEPTPAGHLRAVRSHYLGIAEHERDDRIELSAVLSDGLDRTSTWVEDMRREVHTPADPWEPTLALVRLEELQARLVQLERGWAGTIRPPRGSRWSDVPVLAERALREGWHSLHSLRDQRRGARANAGGEPLSPLDQSLLSALAFDAVQRAAGLVRAARAVLKAEDADPLLAYVRQEIGRRIEQGRTLWREARGVPATPGTAPRAISPETWRAEIATLREEDPGLRELIGSGPLREVMAELDRALEALTARPQDPGFERRILALQSRLVDGSPAFR